MIQPEIRLTSTGEVDLTHEERSAIASLLQRSFNQYPVGRTYFPQPPHFRILGWSGDQLVGHLGGVIREVVAGHTRLVVAGICDLCVDPEQHRQRWASLLLDRLETLARARDIHHVLAITGEVAFFLDRGFQSIDPRCTWLAFLDGKSLGLYRRHIHGDVFVKCLSGQSWPEGDLDLLGPMF